MKIFIKTISSILMCGLFFTSCLSLDIPPKNIITEEQIFSNVAGIDAYMAKMYSDVPMMDRRFSIRNGYNHDYVIENISCLTGEAVGRDQRSTVVNGWWNYTPIREINTFIETLPKYESYHSAEDIKHWLGEAHFLRARIYFVMAQRYGGLPLVTKVLQYPGEDIETFKIPRSSEEDTWRLIESDFQYAIDNCREKSVKGRMNKYTAAAYKSEAMLFAASIANFNEIAHYDNVRGYRLCGIDREQAAYFYKSAYDAAKLVEGHYRLYMDDWVAGDKEAQYNNFHNVLQKVDNCENIFVKEYRYPEITHSWDALYGPTQQKVDGLSGGVSPTLEFVELFEGLPRNSEGLFADVDESGNYIMYDDIHGPYAKVEPRLRATVILPNDIFKGDVIEIWKGIYKNPFPSTGLKKFTDRDLYQKYNVVNDNLAGHPLLLGDKPQNNKVFTKNDGTLMTYSGKSGPYMNWTQGSFTGFLLRKNLDSSLDKTLVVQRRSESDWVDMRYGEVLLNRAEAAYELSQLGETEYLTDAVKCINDIRKRAGCEHFFTAGDITRDDIREEFIRELAFENKTYWNLIRWRIYHIKHDSKVKYHAACPFYAASVDKWFYDVKYNESVKEFTFNPINYYLGIPANQINSNPNLIQNIR